MTATSYFLFALLSLIAEIAGTVGGFGSSAFFIPVANIFVDYKSVLGITALFHLASNVSKLALFKNGINKQLLLTLGIPGVIFSFAGGYLSSYLDETYLNLMLAIFLVLFSSVLLLFEKVKITPNTANSLIGGTISGFMAGIIGTGGAIRGMTLVAFNIEKGIFVATSAAIDLAVDLSRTVVYFTNGYIHTHDLIYIPFLAAISFTGTWIGKKLLSKMSQKQFEKGALIMLLALGLYTSFRIFYTNS